MRSTDAGTLRAVYEVMPFPAAFSSTQAGWRGVIQQEPAQRPQCIGKRRFFGGSICGKIQLQRVRVELCLQRDVCTMCAFLLAVRSKACSATQTEDRLVVELPGLHIGRHGESPSRGIGTGAVLQLAKQLMQGCFCIRHTCIEHSARCTRCRQQFREEQAATTGDVEYASAGSSVLPAGAVTHQLLRRNVSVLVQN